MKFITITAYNPYKLDDPPQHVIINVAHIAWIIRKTEVDKYGSYVTRYTIRVSDSRTGQPFVTNHLPKDLEEIIDQ